MTSKWIEEINKIFNIDLFYAQIYKDGVLIVAERIDKLLKTAAFSTDDENLHDEIMKEIKEEE